MTQKSLLACGIVTMLWYVAMTILVPMQYPGYDSASQTISELSAIDAPTRSLWMMLGTFYSLLFIAFGLGVWFSAKGRRALRVVSSVILFDSIIGFFWPSMHRREVLAAGGGTLTDILHLVWGGAHLLLMLVMIGFGASVFGKGFRIFSVAVVLTFLVFGILTSIDSRGISAGTPTPYVGIWERINIGAYMAWVIVFAMKLIKREGSVSYSHAM